MRPGGALHGPYWYAYWRDGKRLRSLYVGRHRPGAGELETPPRAPLAGDYARLGLSVDASWDDVRRAYRRLAREHHPDRGGATWAMVRLNQAFARIRGALAPKGPNPVG